MCEPSRPGRKPSYTAFVVKAVALGPARLPVREPARVPAALAPLRGPAPAEVPSLRRGRRRRARHPGRRVDRIHRHPSRCRPTLLAEITAALHDLAVCDPSTNRQWREFSTLITRLPSWLSTLLIRLPCLVPSLWCKYRGGAVLVSSPGEVWRRRRRRIMDASAGRLVRARQAAPRRPRCGDRRMPDVRADSQLRPPRDGRRPGRASSSGSWSDSSGQVPRSRGRVSLVAPRARPSANVRVSDEACSVGPSEPESCRS